MESNKEQLVFVANSSEKNNNPDLKNFVPLQENQEQKFDNLYKKKGINHINDHLFEIIFKTDFEYLIRKLKENEAKVRYQVLYPLSYLEKNEDNKEGYIFTSKKTTKIWVLKTQVTFENLNTNSIKKFILYVEKTEEDIKELHLSLSYFYEQKLGSSNFWTKLLSRIFPKLDNREWKLNGLELYVYINILFTYFKSDKHNIFESFLKINYIVDEYRYSEGNFPKLDLSTIFQSTVSQDSLQLETTLGGKLIENFTPFLRNLYFYTNKDQKSIEIKRRLEVLEKLKQILKKLSEKEPFENYVNNIKKSETNKYLLKNPNEINENSSYEKYIHNKENP